MRVRVACNSCEFAVTDMVEGVLPQVAGHLADNPEHTVTAYQTHVGGGPDTVDWVPIGTVKGKDWN